MKRSFNYYWRLLATFLSFSLFGFGGLVMSITIFPVLYALPITRERKVDLSRRALRLSFKAFIGFMHRTGVLTYEIHGLEKISNRPGAFIVANHPSLIDVVFLISRASLPNCVIKEGVWNNPFMYFVVRSSGFIENSAEPEMLLQKCENALKQGDGLIIFPEGTRTDPDGAIKMRRGCAHIALRAEKNLTPVSITCHPITLTKKHRWYNIPLEVKPHFCIRVGDDIDIQPFLEMQKTNSNAAKHLTDYMKKEFLRGMAQ